MDVAVAPPANLQPPSLFTLASLQAAELMRLAPAHSYWAYLPYWVKPHVLKTVHKQLWKSTHALIQKCYCPICGLGPSFHGQSSPIECQISAFLFWWCMKRMARVCALRIIGNSRGLEEELEY